MIIRNPLITSLLAIAARAAQPGATAPIAAPMRDLTWGQLNFLHTTDSHGWLSGHLREPQYSADWGDYISFSQHMRRRADEAAVDLIVVDTGDRVEGSGLYDASIPKGRFQYDIYAEQDIDIICVGNHELYHIYSAHRERNTTVPNFKGSYVASNLDYVDPLTGHRQPMAPRYRRFKTKNQRLDVVAFGFLFDFAGYANNTFVQPVAEAIKEEWFKRAIHEKPDVFVVVGHVGLRMQEFRLIFTALRKQNWHIPILFFGGHMHVRDALSYDSKSFSIASGRYMETIGWMSVSNIKKASLGMAQWFDKSLVFSRSYMDNNLFGMYHHTGLNSTTFPTEHGRQVSGMIAAARNDLRLDESLGCAPQNLWVNRAKYPSNESIYSWLQDHVLPDIVINQKRKTTARLAILNTGAIRFDVFKGPFTRDSILTMSPFVNGFRYVPDVPYKIARKVLGILNSSDKVLSRPNACSNPLAIPQPRLAPETEPIRGTEQEIDEARLELRSVGRSSPESAPQELTPESNLLVGYTTKDDIGSDGDDTIHQPLDFYSVPNCIQSEINFPEEGEPQSVDLVFVDFVQPWIIPALKFSGGDYSDDDVEIYMNGTLTLKLSEWVGRHWAENC